MGFGLGLLGVGFGLGLLRLMFVIRLGFGCFSRAGPVRAGFGAVPAGPGPPLWLREAVLRPRKILVVGGVGPTFDKKVRIGIGFCFFNRFL